MVYEFVTLKHDPQLKQQAAAWFADKWNVPESAYLSCMDGYLSGATPLGWYFCLCNGNVIGGIGAIENDFHNRTDLTPNLCALYVMPQHRNNGIAGKLLYTATEDLYKSGISTVYLLTDHTSFYERYGRRFYCNAQCCGGETSRLYVHKKA